MLSLNLYLLGEDFDQSASLAEYREISLLGKGGFGKVMLMEHESSGQQFAVKSVDARRYGMVLQYFEE